MPVSTNMLLSVPLTGQEIITSILGVHSIFCLISHSAATRFCVCCETRDKNERYMFQKDIQSKKCVCLCVCV